MVALLLSAGCATGGERALEPPSVATRVSLGTPTTIDAQPTPTIVPTPAQPLPTPTPAPRTGAPTTSRPSAVVRTNGPIVSSGGDPSEWVSSNKGKPTFPRCALVKWLYVPDGQSPDASEGSMLSDITEALRRLSLETGLTFQRSFDTSLIGTPNVIVYKWSSALGAPAGQGSYTLRSSGGVTTVTGSVAANPNHWWTGDAYAGFSIVEGPDGRSTGRGWLFVHETMHVLGLGHVDSQYEIMNATLPDLTALGPGDRNGLNTLYAPATCGPPVG